MYRRHRKPSWVRLKAAQDNSRNEARPPKKPLDLDRDELTESEGLDTFEELEKAGKKGSFLGRFNAAFQDVLQSSRGSERAQGAPLDAADHSMATADDLAIRRAKHVAPQRMIVPEGVIIDGSMTSGSETEISGRVEGDVNVDGRLYLGASALITGNVRAKSCVVDGLVEGKMECSQELELGRTGRLNASALAGKRITLAGQVSGSVACGGLLRLVPTARVTGDIQTRQLIIEEGAIFNGSSTMRPQKERIEK